VLPLPADDGDKEEDDLFAVANLHVDCCFGFDIFTEIVNSVTVAISHVS